MKNITTRSKQWKKDINAISIGELIIKKAPLNNGGKYGEKSICFDKQEEIEQQKGTIDYFFEIIYDKILLIDFINEFADNNFISINDFDDLFNKPLSETKFNDYLINDIRIYCQKLYNNPFYFEESLFMKITLKNIIKRWIDNIDKILGDKKQEIFKIAFDKRKIIRQTDYID